ncbi:ganglioside GM2 activator [Aplysia californica]|uniref:Ganglioside GM2 activator n=1 Tax=Aplysia californica TaxID=6500 RepID=A0ABM0JRU3_APLCA|nr:ganglioside GM2 activator [Aplysia californica]
MVMVRSVQPGDHSDLRPVIQTAPVFAKRIVQAEWKPVSYGGPGTYENICHSLETYESMGCPRAMRHHGLYCYCPFTAGKFHFKNLPVNMPKVHGFAGALLNGDYELELRIHEEEGDELGCLHIKFSMKKRNRGWLFKI